MKTMGFIQPSDQFSGECLSTIVEENYTHSHAIGQTGCGKTTSFIYPNLEKRIKIGHSIVFYDFKGKEHMAVKYFAKKNNRLNDVVEIGKPWGLKINLLRLMDRKTITLFLEQIIGFDERNKYWSDAASKLFLSIYDVVQALEAIEVASHQFDYDFNPGYICEYQGFIYPHQLSFESVYGICNSEKNVVEFVKYLDNLCSNIESYYQSILNTSDMKKTDLDSIYERYGRFFGLYKSLLSVVKSAKQSLAVFDDQDGQTTKVSIITTLLPLSSIASRHEFNVDGIDILEMIYAGRIVCINCKDIPVEMVECLTMVMFADFSKRSMLIEKQPISVFIDEAQRVLTKHQDIALDVLRECQVELFLSYQNEELMVNKLGKEKYDAMSKNLTTAFYYKNPGHIHELDLKSLEPYECYSSKNNCLTSYHCSPEYIDPNELYEVELEYQNLYKLHENIGLGKLRDSSIILYDSRLYIDNKVIVYNCHTYKSEIVEFFDAQSRVEVLNLIMKMIQTIEDEAKHWSNELELDYGDDYDSISEDVDAA